MAKEGKGENMRLSKKALPAMLAVVLALGLSPLPAFAESEQTASSSAVMASAGRYAVSDAEGLRKALEEISISKKDSVVEVKGVINGIDPDLLAGVEEARVTYEGSSGAYLSCTGDCIKLKGDATFKNLRVSVSTVYAMGHRLVLDEGFGGGEDGQLRMTVYGGSDADLDLGGESTSVTISGGVYKLIAGGNAAGTLVGNTSVEFGGSASFPTAADGADDNCGEMSTGSGEGYNIYQKADMESSWNPVLVSYTKRGVLPYGIYGGGINANTTGNTTVTMTGGEVYQIFGGGAANVNPNYAKPGEESGMVGGDATVSVTGGSVKSIYGGGYNGVDVFGGDDYDKVPDDARLTRAAVGGLAAVSIGGEAFVPCCGQSEDASVPGCDPAAVHGGSFHSTVGSAQVVVGGSARIETGGDKGVGYGRGSLFGAGSNDVVLGTTKVVLKGNARIGSDENVLGTAAVSQGYYGNMTPLGYASKSGCYIGGAEYSYGSEVLNQGGDPYAASAIVEGGRVDVVGVGCKSRNTEQASKSVNGNVLISQTGGSVAAIEAGCITNKKTTVAGDVDVHVSGGEVASYIGGHYGGMYGNDKCIEGVATLELSGTAADGGYRVMPLIQNMDSVTVKDGGKIAIDSAWGVYDYDGKYPPNYEIGFLKGAPFWRVHGLNIEKGAALALEKPGLIEGDIAINGQLEIKRHDLLVFAGVDAPLIAEGVASGSGTLLPFAKSNYGEGSLPKVDEEYVYAEKDGSSMMLTLANENPGNRRVAVRDEGADRSVWYIAEDQIAPVEQRYHYEVYYESAEEDGSRAWVKWKAGEKSCVSLDQKVGISPADFNDMPTGRPSCDGSGIETLGVHYIFDEGNELNRLEALAKEATEDNPLKIYYKLRPHEVAYSFEGDVPEGAQELLPGTVESAYSCKVAIASAPMLAGYIFTGWKTSDVPDDLMEENSFRMPNKDVQFVGSWQKKEDVLSYDKNSEDAVGDTPVTSGLEGLKVTVAENGFKLGGHEFDGWNTKADGTGDVYVPGSEYELTAQDDVLYAQWRRVEAPIVPPVVPPAVDKVTLFYEENGGRDIQDATVARGSEVALATPVREGFTFDGWYNDEGLSDFAGSGGDLIKLDSDRTVWAKWSRTDVPSALREDHVNYVIGRHMAGARYIAPQSEVTRAEAAAMLFRLLDDDVRLANLTYESPFPDVGPDMWYTQPVSTLAAMGVIGGYPQDGTFRPDEPITRAELSALAVRLDDRFEEGVFYGHIPFVDMPEGHWAESVVSFAVNSGWLLGDLSGEDPTFRPDQTISRAETMAIFNRVLQRLPNSEEDLIGGRNEWPDNQDRSAWYWLTVEEATNNHDHEDVSGDHGVHAGEYVGEHERWTNRLEDIEWDEWKPEL